MKTIRRAFLLLIIGTLLFTSAVSCKKLIGGTASWESAAAQTIVYSEPETMATMTEASENQRLQTEILKRIDNKTPYGKLINKKLDMYAFIQEYGRFPYTYIHNIPPSLAQVDADFGIECLRQSEAGSYYSVHELLQGGLLYVFYDTDSNSLDHTYMEIHSWYVVQNELSFEDFSGAARGVPLGYIEGIDSAAIFYKQRLYSCDEYRTDGAFYTQHYLKDGVLTINYRYENNQWVVDQKKLMEDFTLSINGGAMTYYYDGHILDIDVYKGPNANISVSTPDYTVTDPITTDGPGLTDTMNIGSTYDERFNFSDLHYWTDPAPILTRQNTVLARLNNSVPYTELITKTTDLTAFLLEYDPNPHILQTHPTLAEIDEKIGIECIRKSDAGNYYSVHKLKQGGLLYIFYYVPTNHNGEHPLKMYRWFTAQKNLSYKDFASVAKGSSYEQVERIDPAAAVYKQKALAFDVNVTYFYSQHYLTDGILTIHYKLEKGKWSVTNVSDNHSFQVDDINNGSWPVYDGRIQTIDFIQ